MSLIRSIVKGEVVLPNELAQKEDSFTDEDYFMPGKTGTQPRMYEVLRYIEPGEHFPCPLASPSFLHANNGTTAAPAGRPELAPKLASYHALVVPRPENL